MLRCHVNGLAYGISHFAGEVYQVIVISESISVEVNDA